MRLRSDSASGVPYSEAEALAWKEQAAQAKEEAKDEAKKDRSVQLWSWWKAPASGRKFAVVDKLAKGEGHARKTTQIKLLEVDDSNPFYRDVAEFWRLVDSGKLVELVHDAIDTPKEIS